jgi:5-methylcytosine-specific restriction protein A
MSPWRAARPCSNPTCAKLNCEEHRRERAVVYDRQRGSAAQRGYTQRWAQYSRDFLQANPWCARCLRVGKREPAQMVDHIRPVQSADDPLFWQVSNHQSLSRRCHAVKTAEDKMRGLTR